MMVLFFAQVLVHHPDCIASLPEQNGMLCVSSVNYELPENRNETMPSYFKMCRYLEFPNGQSLCIGTTLPLPEKLKKMSLLLTICEVTPSSVFSSDQVELPDINSEGRGTTVTYRVYNETYTTNVTDMMGNIFHEVIRRHPDKLEDLAEKIGCLAIEDYKKLPKDQRPTYFASCRVFEQDGKKYSVGSALPINDKLKQFAKLLSICGEDKSTVEIDGYNLPDADRGSGRRKKEAIDYFNLK